MPAEPIVNILSEVELLNLNAMTKHPGFPVLEKLHMFLCDRANKDLLKLEPGSEGYNLQVAAFQQRAKIYNEFSLQILKACFWQAEVDAVKEQLELPIEKPKQEPTAPLNFGNNNPVIKRIMGQYERNNSTTSA